MVGGQAGPKCPRRWCAPCWTRAPPTAASHLHCQQHRRDDNHHHHVAAAHRGDAARARRGRHFHKGHRDRRCERHEAVESEHALLHHRVVEKLSTVVHNTLGRGRGGGARRRNAARPPAAHAARLLPAPRPCPPPHPPPPALPPASCTRLHRPSALPTPRATAGAPAGASGRCCLVGPPLSLPRPAHSPSLACRPAAQGAQAHPNLAAGCASWAGTTGRACRGGVCACVCVGGGGGSPPSHARRN